MGLFAGICVISVIKMDSLHSIYSLNCIGLVIGIDLNCKCELLIFVDLVFTDCIFDALTRDDWVICDEVFIES